MKRIHYCVASEKSKSRKTVSVTEKHLWCQGCVQVKKVLLMKQ